MYLEVISALTTGMTRHSMEFMPFVWLNLDIAYSSATLKSKVIKNEGALANGWHQGF
jgi:hypothetical protein